MLGMLSFYRRHIENFAKIASPITALMKKENSFRWTEICEKAMRTLIERVTSASILRFPILDSDHPFILTDSLITRLFTPRLFLWLI